MIPGIIVSIFCILPSIVYGGVYEYFVSGEEDTRVTLSRCIASKDLERLKEASSEFEGGTLVLPTDDAWQATPRSCAWYKLLMDDKNSGLRKDLMLETGTLVPGSWDQLQTFVTNNDNIIDAASGNVYYIDLVDQSVCIAEWQEEDAKYVPTEKCSKFSVPPLGGGLLGDQHIYLLDKVIMPSNLEGFLNAAITEECPPGEVLKCEN